MEVVTGGPDERAALRAKLSARQDQLREQRAAKQDRRAERRAAGGRLSTTARRDVYAIIAADGPMTDEAIADHYRILVDAGGARPASTHLLEQERDSLVKRGLIIPTGTPRRTRSGRPATTWAAVHMHPREIASRLNRRTFDDFGQPFRDAWVKRISRTSDGSNSVAIRCPYCDERHDYRVTSIEADMVTASCDGGPIRLRFGKAHREQLQDRP